MKGEDYEKRNAFEVLEIRGNVFLNEGINLIWTAVCGGSYTPFNASNAHIGVGDSDATESASQTGLQGTNKYYKAMDLGYPVYGSNQQAVFRATFNENEANFAWKEITVANGNNDTAVNLNRKVQDMGTKSQGSIWVATLTLSIS